MKNVLIFLSLMFFVISNSFAQMQVDSSNIVKELVRQQIMMAKEKQNRLIAENSVVPNTIKPETEAISDSKPEISASISSVGIKLGIILFASLVAFGIIVVRRRKIRMLNKRNELKANIKKIRNEQLVVSIDPRLKAIRKKLVLNSSYLNKNEKNKFARENKLAPSEISLAEKLKQYEEAVLERGVL